MKKIFLILCVFCLFLSVNAFSQDIEIESVVIIVKPDYDFFVIKAGEDRGVEMGDGLIVHRGGEKIAEAYIIEVRPAVSAAEILSVTEGRSIKEGDGILIVKKPGASLKSVMEIEEVTPYVDELADAYAERAAVISIKIDSDPATVFSYAGLTLRESGYSVTFSNRSEGILLASKPIELSLLRELWADAFAAINHNLVASFEIKAEGASSRLKVTSFREHSQKDKYIKRPVVNGSKYYNELVDVVSKIKQRSED